ncbi:MAG: hypothetical protein LBD25_04235 [Coriobacteriales bacterium]|jgi:phenylalanyl-tRNA synthetase alpha chain|nr:hypothetical protein [Coriobacteriales bacterium]
MTGQTEPVSPVSPVSPDGDGDGLLRYSAGQQARLVELGLLAAQLQQQFESEAERNRCFQSVEKQAVRDNRARLKLLLSQERQVALCRLSSCVASALVAAGFTQVSTPSIIPRVYLERMGIDEHHPLCSQIFWQDRGRCLRPMLAPGLYAVSQQLLGSQSVPVRIFEIGSCFRRESDGQAHLSEFTMLNLVEWGTAIDERQSRQRHLIDLVLSAAGLEGCSVIEEDSTVYGTGVDVVDGQGLELASSSLGPHRLDAAWRIDCSWVGVGFGLERLLMSKSGGGIHRWAKSFTYLDGACLCLR